MAGAADQQPGPLAGGRPSGNQAKNQDKKTRIKNRMETRINVRVCIRNPDIADLWCRDLKNVNIL